MLHVIAHAYNYHHNIIVTTIPMNILQVYIPPYEEFPTHPFLVQRYVQNLRCISKLAFLKAFS